ncbi:formate/nitrite transporter family protein [Ornithinimicrobium sediminis]|uniref:formate/nitrite transporter family protein n=1 Tax=Ornithinimicrobium sediminis TaxID=2904603 RepID=UPI001E4FD724|nr:formate/nitrite transporter family protein [Ornithinimicrobium sediminis]MCE0485838.1 formate/nitrite transporter family protein [Ornithinimicrobium sediminis]
MNSALPHPPALDPQEIYERAEAEGERRLSMTLQDQAMTGFIAGVTVVFGIVALGVVEALVEPSLGAEVAKLAGALAFAIGLVFLIVGRTELFSENFFDPVAAAVKEGGAGAWARLARLWVTILVLNLVGGAVLLAVVSIDGALPDGAPQALVVAAEEIAAKTWVATLARSVLAGALVALLSYMLNAVDTVVARIIVAYMVGFLLALGPFDHVVVSALHLLFGVWASSAVGYADLGVNLALATVGNIAGGLLLITLTHTAQVQSERG